MEISVVMTVYNGEKYLRDAINSILNQTFTDFEFIIVNDGSTDSTGEILKDFTDKRIKVLQQYPNNGAANGLNRGIAESKGKWVAIQDADDVSHPERLQQQMDYLKSKRGVVLLGSLIQCYQDNEGKIKQHRLKILDEYWNNLITKKSIDNEILRSCPLCHGSVIYSRKVFNQIGGYDPRYKIAYDWELWLRFWEKGLVEKVPKILYYYQLHEKSLSRSNWPETCNEMMRISLRYICKYKCSPHKKPSFVVIGSMGECDNFKRNIAFKSVKIIDYLYDDLSWEISRHIHLYKKSNYDGFLIIEGKNSSKIIYEMQKSGLRLNRDFYRLHSKWNYID